MTYLRLASSCAVGQGQRTPQAALLAHSSETTERLGYACTAQNSLQELSCSVDSELHVTLLLALCELSLHPLSDNTFTSGLF